MSEIRIPVTFQFPAGDVTQAINPWTFTGNGNQIGLFNVSLGESSAPAVEQDAIRRVGSYGKQIGRIADALEALIAALDRSKALTGLTKDDEAAFESLKAMQIVVRDIKKEHGRP